METCDMDFELANFGDIIWAKRYKNEENMLSIPEGHREGPYVVIENRGNYLVCLYCSSHPDTRDSECRNFLLNDKSLSMNKETYVQVSQVRFINRNRFIKSMSSLSLDDIEKLKRMIDISASKGRYVDFDFDIPKVELGKGDIVFYRDKRYLIIGDTGNKFEVLPIYRTTKKNKNNVLINDEVMAVAFDHLTSLSKFADLRRVDFVDTETLRRVLALYKNRITELIDRKRIKRGSLIRLDNKLYYVYGEINDKLMTFSVIDHADKYMCNIVIGTKNFYTDFLNESEIEKNNPGISLLYSASTLEAEVIKKQRKTFVKPPVPVKDPNWYQRINKPEIQAGSVIRIFNKDVNDLYVVIVRAQDEVVALPLQEVLNFEYKTLFKLKVTEIKKVNEIVGMNLKDILVAIYDIADGFINKKKLRGMIKTLSENKE